MTKFFLRLCLLNFPLPRHILLLPHIILTLPPHCLSLPLPLLMLTLSSQPLDPLSDQSGHISRNARLALLAIDVAAPYLCFESATLDHSVPFNTTESSQSSRILDPEVQVPVGFPPKGHPSERTLSVSWYVGGAVTVDYTLLSLHLPPPLLASNLSVPLQDIPWSSILDQLQPPHIGVGRNHKSRVLQASNKTSTDSTSASASARNGKSDFPLLPMELSVLQSGEARWGGRNPHRPQAFSSSVRIGLKSPTGIEGSEDDTAQNKNSANRLKTVYLPPGIYWIVSWAQVDRSWGKSDQGGGSKNPESYLANARTSTKWKSVQVNKAKEKEKRLRFTESGGSPSPREEYRRTEPRVVNGREMWPSDPLILEVTSEGEILLQSTVIKCAWWSRTESESEEFKARSREDKKNSLSAGFGVPTLLTPNPDQYGEGTDWDFTRRTRKQWFALRVVLVIGVILAVLNCVYFRSSFRRRRGSTVLYQSVRTSEPKA
jgi:hypothetical protein